MRILVIGSEGNVGKQLVPYLEKTHDVFCVDIKAGNREGYRQADINFPLDLHTVFLGFQPDVVYCLAAMVGRDTCEKASCMAITTNVTGTNNIVQLCKLYKAKLIYFSTSEVYGNLSGYLSESRLDLNPNNLYGLSKLLSERIIQYEVDKGLDAIIVRPCMLYHEDETMGEHRSAMIRFAEKLVKKECIEIHEGSKRGWLHMDDAVRAFSAMLQVEGFHIINIGNPKIETMEYVAQCMCDIYGLDLKKYSTIISQPDGMTLLKIPTFIKQNILLLFTPQIELEKGISRVIGRMLRRVNDGG